MRYSFLLLLSFIIISCSQKASPTNSVAYEKASPAKIVTYKPYDSSIPITPPNGYKLNDSLFIDRSEVSNINYKLFLNYCLQTYGKDSEIYNSLQIDTTVWREVENPMSLTSGKYIDVSKLYESEYLRNISFDDHPVVGISYDQAVKFTDWRTDRVLEMLLIEHGYKNTNAVYAPFTLEDYFNSKYADVHVVDYFRFPYYFLIEDVEALKKLDPGYIYAEEHYNKYLSDNEVQFTLPSFTVTMEPERLLGNVAEMTATKGVAFGGSWMHSLSQCHLDSIQTYDGPKNWLGFRNMSKVVTYEEYKKLRGKR